MEAINKPTVPTHFSYTAQENINPKFPQAAGSKPQVGAVQMEADIAPDKLSVSTTTNGQKKQAAAETADKMGTATGRLDVLTTLVNGNFTLAFGGVAAQPAGSENVGAVAADRYDINTATADATTQAGFQTAAAMLSGKTKVQSVKGSVWIDKATGRLVRYNVDTQFSDSTGDNWSEHHELLVTQQ